MTMDELLEYTPEQVNAILALNFKRLCAEPPKETESKETA